MLAEKMRATHIETNKDNTPSAHQERQINRLEAGVSAVSDYAGIERKAIATLACH